MAVTDGWPKAEVLFGTAKRVAPGFQLGAVTDLPIADILFDTAEDVVVGGFRMPVALAGPGEGVVTCGFPLMEVLFGTKEGAVIGGLLTEVVVFGAEVAERAVPDDDGLPTGVLGNFDTGLTGNLPVLTGTG